MYVVCSYFCMAMNNNSMKNSNQMYLLFSHQTIGVSFLKRIRKPIKDMNETKRAWVCVCANTWDCIVFVVVAQNAARAAHFGSDTLCKLELRQLLPCGIALLSLSLTVLSLGN